jgi:preprotein translocase subunit SecE
VFALLKVLFKELFSVRLYKNSQGRLARRATMIAIVLLFASGAYKFTQIPFENLPLLNDAFYRYIVAGILTLAGWWIAFRVVHFPVFADFLVSVEAEMVKVSWPQKNEVYSSTLVVLAMFLIMAGLIFTIDIVWLLVFRWLGVIVA